VGGIRACYVNPLGKRLRLDSGLEQVQLLQSIQNHGPEATRQSTTVEDDTAPGWRVGDPQLRNQSHKQRGT
jgi:hypothetical protein